ncbi:MAG: hypothetical protein WCO52_01030 [bacterium]
MNVQANIAAVGMLSFLFVSGIYYLFLGMRVPEEKNPVRDDDKKLAKVAQLSSGLSLPCGVATVLFRQWSPWLMLAVPILAVVVSYLAIETGRYLKVKSDQKRVNQSRQGLIAERIKKQIG